MPRDACVHFVHFDWRYAYGRGWWVFALVTCAAGVLIKAALGARCSSRLSEVLAIVASLIAIPVCLAAAALGWGTVGMAALQQFAVPLEHPVNVLMILALCAGELTWLDHQLGTHLEVRRTFKPS